MNTTRILSVTALTFAAMIPMNSNAAHEVFLNGQSIYGQPAAGATPSRVIDLAKNQRSTVEYGETVAFKGADGKQFVWTFNGLDKRNVAIAEIAPRDFQVGQSSVLIGRDPAVVEY